MIMVGVILMLPYDYGRLHFDATPYDMVGIILMLRSQNMIGVF